MTKTLRLLLAFALVAAGGFVTAGTAAADFEDSEATNQQEGDNAATSEQAGSSGSGDAVGGQVTGIVSSGDASVDARNRSEDVDVDSGNTAGSDFADSFVGHDFNFTSATQAAPPADFESSTGTNQQEGDNSLDLTQAADASSGDGVGGQVIGVVTSAGGSADVVADNASEDVDVETGDAFAGNFADSFVGLEYFAFVLTEESQAPPADFESSSAPNQQEGDNSLSADQTADATSGDGVAGQVIGVVSAGDASIDARNRSEDVDIETGDAFADNFANPFVGLIVTSVNVDLSADFESSTAVNQQEGDNDASLSQAANASTGDGVGGQVIGSVTSAGGSTDIVADNASEDADVETGDTFAGNFSDAFVGLSFTTVSVDITVDFESSTATANQQEGNNTLDLNQTADASSGDGVAGQVIGAVSAGDASIDARNRSEDVEVETGNAFADNFDGSFVGLSAASVNLDIVVTPDFESSTAINQQEGDNALDLNQTAAASTGDGVGGQVIGAVTSADGSADIVADNASEDADAETGDAIASNFSGSFVGLNYLALNATITFLDFESSSAVNQQEGNNALDVMQTADASSGDGVAGQVIGVVSAGDASIDARNRSEDVDVSTGDAVADNFADSFVGLDFSSVNVDVGADFESSTGVNQQEGDNNASLSQTANASSGDAVGGQVIGVVTSAGGSADAVLDNASEDVDAETGGSFFENDDTLFVGLNIGTAPVFLVL